MARKSWQSVVDAKSQSKPPSASRLAHASPAPGTLEEAGALAKGSALSGLLSERKVLERQMQGLVSGEHAPGSSTDPRFPVKSFADRLQETKTWEQGRDRLGYQRGNETKERIFDPDVLGPAFRETPIEQRLSADGISRSLQNSTPTSALNKINDVTRMAGLQNRLRREPKYLRVGKKAVTKLRGSVNKLQNDLKDMDKQLAANDISQADRNEIKSLLRTKEIGKASSALKRADSLLSAPRRAANKIESDWRGRREKIDGAMDRTGSYTERRNRRLSSALGGSGDLFVRAAQARLRALERRRGGKREEAADQRRRDRASKRRQKKDKEAKELSR